jgi:hypothetical protein
VRGGTNKEKGRKVLAWVSFGFAVAAGAGAAFTFIGSWIAGILGFFPAPWLPPLLLAAAVVTMAMDIFVDSEPNQAALYTAMIVPSLAAASSGRLADTVRQGAGQIQTQLALGIGDWLGVSAGFGFVLVAGAVSILMGRRVVAKGGGGGGR